MPYDSHRLKKIQGKKKRDAESAEAARKALLAEQGLEPVVEAKIPDAVEDLGDGEGSRNLLSSKDEDVIF